MADKIRHDSRGGLSVTRDRATVIGRPVVFDGTGAFRVGALVPAAVMGVRTAVGASLVEGPLNFAYSTSSNTALVFPTQARLVVLSLSLQTALSAGSVTLQAQRAGSNVSGAVLTSGTLPAAVWFGDNGPLFELGQSLGLVLSTTSDFAPTSQIIVATAWVALIP